MEQARYGATLPGQQDADLEQVMPSFFPPSTSAIQLLAPSQLLVNSSLTFPTFAASFSSYTSSSSSSFSSFPSDPSLLLLPF